jgi:hypothetical protein
LPVGTHLFCVKTRLESLLAKFIIELALWLITENVMSQRHFFEALFSLFVPLIHVGMILPRELPVGFFNLVG